jgi:hypothetical protein
MVRAGREAHAARRHFQGALAGVVESAQFADHARRNARIIVAARRADHPRPTPGIEEILLRILGPFCHFAGMENVPVCGNKLAAVCVNGRFSGRSRV